MSDHSHPPPRSIPLPVHSSPDPTVWYADGLHFTCTQCGNCCSGAPGFVWVTLDDMQRIASYLGLAFDDFTRTFIRRIGDRYSLTEAANYDCSFLTRSGGKTGCRIYPVRPTQCRTWPFWSDNLQSRAAWDRAAQRCPGMRDPAAQHHDLAHIEQYRQEPGSPH